MVEKPAPAPSDPVETSIKQAAWLMFAVVLTGLGIWFAIFVGSAPASLIGWGAFAAGLGLLAVRLIRPRSGRTH